jgi:hypothetical protein
MGICVISISCAGIRSTSEEFAISSSRNETVEDQLRKLQDRVEIRQLLMDYGRFLDQRDFAAFSDLFAEKEGEWIGGLGSAKGSRNVRDLMEKTIGTDSPMIKASNFHLFTNETIRLNGDRAEATTKWIFVVRAEDGRPQPVFLGHYEDTIIRENGRWKFLRRVVHGDIPADNPLES